MPQLPDFTSLGERPVPQGAGQTAQYQPPNWRQVGMAGYTAAGAGREVEQAADMVAASNEHQNRIASEAALNQLQQQRISLEFDQSNGFKNVKEGNAAKASFVDDYMGKFNDASAQIASGLANDQQREFFRQRAPIASLQYRSALLQHQASETEKFNDSTANDTVNLALRQMAIRPTDELSFQTGLAQINGTIDELGKRKGLPAESVAQLKGHYLDNAYSTRIMSILNGVPGAVQASPYLAEKMFEQVQDKLGPQLQTMLGHQVLQGIKQVQQRDLAQSLVYSGKITDPKPLQQVVDGLESAGKRFGSDGTLLTSPKGAKGEMQVMPPTAKDPGYGVTPAKDDSPDELARVGRDYLGVMVARYNDPALALAAYNAGPGKVDDWLAKNGDPRTGQLSQAEWAAKVPFAETRKYVLAGLQKLGDTSAAPTKREMKTDLPALMDRAREVAGRMYPGDTAFADGLVSRVGSYGNQVLAQVQAQEGAAADYVSRQIVAGAKSVDDITGTPEGKQAWNNLTPHAQLAVSDRFARGDKKQTLDEDSAKTYYALLGQAGNDPEGFTKVDLAGYFGQMPDHLLLGLMAAQKSINQKDATQQAKDLNWQKTVTTVDDMLKPMGLGKSAKANTQNSKTTEQFYGRLNEAVQQWHDTNQKWPDTQTTRKLAASLLTEGAQSGGMLWDSKTRVFQADDLSKFYVPLPPARSAERTNLNQIFERVTGHKATDAELQQWYTRYRMSGAK